MKKSADPTFRLESLPVSDTSEYRDCADEVQKGGDSCSYEHCGENLYVYSKNLLVLWEE